MGKIKNTPAVKLIIGFIFKEERELKKAEDLLRKRYGAIDFESRILDFTHSDYYQEEFGRGLKRKFIAFKKLIPAQKLARIKTAANQIEKKLSKGRHRLVNIDPGYLDMAKLVLASTKDYYHRIYLDNGIFAEITLFYRGKTFTPWEWTYPDYKTPEYIAIFNRLREIYAASIR